VPKPQRRTLEQRRKTQNSHAEEAEDGDADEAANSKQQAAPAPGRRTAKQPLVANLGNARTPTAPSNSARMAVSRNITVKKPQREAQQSQMGDISRRVATQRNKDEKQPLQAHTTKPKPALVKDHLSSSQRQAPPATSTAAPAPVPQRPAQRVRVPSASSSKKSIDWFDDEAFTF
jgi:hypothetical protein